MSPNGGSPYGILVAPIKFAKKKEMTNHDRLFGATKIPFGGPPFGDTQNPREKLIPSHLEFYESRFALYES